MFPTFTGNSVQPGQVGYASFSLTASIALAWPNFVATGNVVAMVMDITSSSSAFTITMPNATQVGNGSTALFRNTGAQTITILANDGTTLTTVAAGVAKFIYLTSNATAAGTWGVVTFGTGSSSADASALAGYGLIADGLTLDQSHPTNQTSGTITIAASSRASAYVATGGSVPCNLPTSASVGSNFFFLLKNNGTGTVTITPSGADVVDGAVTLALAPSDACMVCSLGSSNAWVTVGYGRSVTFAFTQLVKSVAGGADVTLTSTECANKVMSFTGVLTGNINLIVTSTVSVYYIYNNTTGAFTLTVKTAAGTGITVTQGTRDVLVCDGTNVRRAVDNTSATTLFSDGNAGNPSISFSNDTTTGLYRPGAGLLAASVLGSDVMRWAGVASAVNRWKFTNSAAGNPLLFDADGTDGNISVRMRPKGTGRMQFTDGTDVSKIAEFVLSGITAATTRSITVQDASYTLAGTNLANTFSSAQTFSAAITYGGVTLSNAVTGTGNMVLSASPTLSGTVGGALTFSGALTLSSALTYGGVTLSNAVTGTGNMVLSASPTLSGTVGGALTFSGALTLSSALTYGGVTLSNAVTGTGNMVLATAPAIAGGTHTALTSLGIRSTGAALDLTLASSEVLTAGRTLTITLNDAARTLTISGNATISGTSSGTNTGDQTITLTSDVTGSGTGSFATTIAANVVGDTKLRQGTALTVIGRSANSTGNVADIAGTNNQVLRVSGSVLGFGSVDVSTAQVSGIMTSANGGTGNGFTKFSGASASEKTYTLPNASATILTDNAAVTVGQGGTGVATLTNHGVLLGQAGSAIVATAAGSSGQILRSGGGAADPAWSTATYPTAAGTAGNVLRSDGTNLLSAALAAADLSNGVQGSGAVVLATSPTITTAALGSSTATTQAANDNSTKLATTAYIDRGSSGATQVLIQTQNSAGLTNVDFTSGITSTYDQYVVRMTDVTPGTDGANLLLQVTEDGSNFKSGATDYGWGDIGQNDAGAPTQGGSANDSSIQVCLSLSNTKSFSGEVRFFAPSGTARHKLFYKEVIGELSGITVGHRNGGGVFKLDTNAINGIRFSLSSGTFSNGTFALYGVRKS